MSRFTDDYYDEDFDNQSLLFWANCERALKGKRGQQALRELREAMLALPEPCLISGRLADEKGGVCAVGALIVKKRVEKGEERRAVIDELAQKLTDNDDYMGADVTATAGTSIGLTYALAYRLAYLNDEDYANYSPEERYNAVLRWIDGALAGVMV